MAITSRSEPDIAGNLPAFVEREIAIGKKQVDQDIASYIRGRFDASDELALLPMDMVEQVLLSKANGMSAGTWIHQLLLLINGAGFSG